jgi:hypothetical protein
MIQQTEKENYAMLMMDQIIKEILRIIKQMEKENVVYLLRRLEGS